VPLLAAGGWCLVPAWLRKQVRGSPTPAYTAHAHASWAPIATVTGMTTTVSLSDRWHAAPLFRRETLRRLQRVQEEVNALRREQAVEGGAVSAGAAGRTHEAPTTSPGDHVRAFLGRRWAMLPCLTRIQWARSSQGPPPRHTNAQLHPVPVHSAPQQQQRPGSSTTQAAEPTAERFALHFHSMGPGLWSMACWGEPPLGFGWGIAIRPLLDLVTGLSPSSRQFVACRRRRVRLEQVCFKPHVEPDRFRSADTRWPLLLLASTQNPHGLPFRCIDGKHRVHRLIADCDAARQRTRYDSPAVGAAVPAAGPRLQDLEVDAVVLSLEEVAPFVVGLPLCALPPLSMGSGRVQEDDVRWCTLDGALRYLTRQGLVGPRAATTSAIGESEGGAG
jgi:hypothetical protein